MSATVSFIVHLPARPERREELESGLVKVLDQMAGEPDFVRTDVHRLQDDPDTLVLYETWACSREYFMSHHLGRAYRRDYEAVLPGLLKSPRTIEFLEPVRGYALAR